jgi:hypothetical protein
MISPLASVSRPALGPTQPPVHWVLGILSPGLTLTTYPHLVLRSRMSGSYTSSPPKRLRGVQWDSFSFSLTCSVMLLFTTILFLWLKNVQTRQ